MIIASSPLTFTPQKGGITLFPVNGDEEIVSRERTESPGPINLFDSTPYKEFKSMLKEKRVEKAEETVVGGIWASKVSGERFEFDWPSEEIRKACEALFPQQGQNEELPVLNWIPDEITEGHGNQMTGIEQ